MEGWIKFHRRFLKWEWYDKSEMVHLFIHLLLSVNHEDKKWRGIPVKKGQIITGINALSRDTGLSVKVIRTCLSRLQKTGEIGRQTGNRYSVITINNYDSYQIQNAETGKQMGKQGASKGQARGNKQECKEGKKEKNIKERALKFKTEILEEFKEKYPHQMLIDFFTYWSEPSTDGKKMRKELEKTWLTSGRLATWNRRQQKSGYSNQPPTSNPPSFKKLNQLEL